MKTSLINAFSPARKNALSELRIYPFLTLSGSYDLRTIQEERQTKEVVSVQINYN